MYLVLNGPLAAEAINHVLSGVRDEKAVHLCFGNYGGQTIQAGFLRALLPFFNALSCDHLVLEFARRDSVPDFALERALGMYDPHDRVVRNRPIDLDAGIDESHLHYGEVKLQDGRLVTSGPSGYALVVTGRGSTAEQAQRDAYARVRQVRIPNLRYRNDIGTRFIEHDRATLRSFGLLP